MRRFALFVFLLLFSVAASAEYSGPSTTSSGIGGITVGAAISGTCPNGQDVFSNSGLIGCHAAGSGSPGGSVGQVQFNSAGSFGGFTLSGDCTLNTSTGVITCSSIGGKAVTLGGPLTTTGAGTTTLAFAAAGVTYTFPAGAATLLATNGDGSGLTNLAYTQLPALSANQVLGALTATTPSGLTLPSCAGATNALKYTLGTGFGCNTISAGGPVLGAPAYNTGNSIWYSNPYTTTVNTSAVQSANAIVCAPFWIYGNVTIKALGARIIATSAGNSSLALAGAFYNNLQRTDGVNRPGTLVDNTSTPFATGSAASVSAPLTNTTDALTGPAMYWSCVQTFDGTVSYGAISTLQNYGIGAAIGSATLSNLLGTAAMNGVRYSGASAFNVVGATGWANFTSSTTWTENITNVWGPTMAIQVN